MSEEQKCRKCGAPLSLDVGIVSHTEGNPEVTRLYCEPCAPNQGKGYTIADLHWLREESQTARAAYETSQMDKVGPDVYFAVKGRPKD